MKTRYNLKISAFILTASFLFCRGASAFLPQLAIDTYPMPDFFDTMVSTMKSAGNLAHTTQKTINAAENNLNNLKTAAMAAYSGSPTTLLNTGALNNGQKSIIDCNYKGKKYKMTKESDIADLSEDLFLQYPAKSFEEISIKNEYDGYRQSFYRDSIMEIYTASLALESELEAVSQPMVDNTIKCLKGESSSCGTPPPDGNNDSAFVEGKGLEATANLYELLLKVTALKAQLAAVKVINETTPAPYAEKGKKKKKQEEPAKEASLNLGVVYAKAQISTVSNVAFAQLGINDQAATSLADIEAQSKLSATPAKAYIDTTLSFMSAPEDAETHPYTDAADKMAELDKIAPISEMVDTALEAHNLSVRLEDYKGVAESLNEAKAAHKRALDALKVSDKCALSYLGRRYSNPQTAWAGRSLGGNINNADIRRGISGWALEAFETAKAAQITERSTDNVVVVDIDPDEHDLSDISNTNKNTKLLEAGAANSISSNKQEQAAKEARETQMLSWQIGSEGSQLLAADPTKWGSPTKKKEVWTDTKTFYNQYLQFKYDNIRSYLKPYSKNDILAVVAEQLKGSKNADIDKNKKQQAIAKATEQLGNTLAVGSDQEKKTLAHQTSAHRGQVSALEKRRQSVLDKMKTVDDKQKELADKLSGLRSKAQDDAADSMQKIVTYKADFPEGGYLVPNAAKDVVRKVDSEEAMTEKFDKAVVSNKEGSEIKQVQQQLDSEKQKLGSLEKQLAAIDAEAANYRVGAPAKTSSLLEKMSAQRIKQSDDAMDKISMLDVAYSGDVKAVLMAALLPLSLANPLLQPEMLYLALDRAAGKALDDLYAKVDARIASAQKQMENLGDNLYDPAFHNKVVEIHQAMVNDIKAMTVSVAVMGIPAVNDIEVYAKLAMADVSAEEEDYFVGAAPKARDMKAPKAIFELKLPPLREAVHFDEVDWQNVSPYAENLSKSPTIMKADFLNYGGKIPEIWKKMLTENVFVEKSIDMKAALNQGCETVAFYRGGVMPCRVKNSAIVLDVDDKGQYVKGSASDSVNECANIEMRSGKPYHTLREVGITLSTFFAPNAKPAAADCQYSELGSLLDADGNGALLFRQSAYDAFYNIIYEQKHTDKERSSSENMLMTVFDQAPLKRDQIGDFLTYFEIEQAQRKNVEEIQKEYDTSIKELFDLFKEYGFTPSASFDISKESDYNLARQKLDGIKNRAVSAAQLDLAPIDIVDNAVVLERVDIIRSMIAALQKDEQETTIVSAGVDDDNHLDEDIKSSKVNTEVADKFSKSLDKSAAKAQNGLAPYCSNY